MNLGLRGVSTEWIARHPDATGDAVLLPLTTTHRPTTDLGDLLHKNPARSQEFSLSFGHAHVFYPEASAERCTAALLLDLDPVGLVRDRQEPGGNGLALIPFPIDRNRPPG